MSDQFRASVQYNDFTGSAAADRADRGGPEEWLRSKGLAQPDEFVLGIEVWAGENAGVHRDPVSVHFVLVTGTFDSVEPKVRSARGTVRTTRVSAEMSIAEFMGLFKRFSVSISPKGMLDGKRYEYTER
ncbi:MAG TPA: hypothetical protein VFK39_00915 [Gemmatimonadaceae bacterium]|jgi:hypothetical protein|nr:hypothetical protein [Gemmatimonadaceae bacterium]